VHGLIDVRLKTYEQYAPGKLENDILAARPIAYTSSLTVRDISGEATLDRKTPLQPKCAKMNR